MVRDARKEEEVAALVEDIESRIGAIEVFVFNIGANVPCSVLDETARKYFKIWEMACFSGFLNGREVAKRMVARQRGTIIFTGATASLRGGASFAAFAGAKHALRALAQSMARELGPRTSTSRTSIIDGAIDTAFIRDNFPERYALKARTASSSRNISPTRTGSCTSSRATPGPSNWTCVPGRSAGREKAQLRPSCPSWPS